MTPRSLVGMTMGARKRAALRELRSNPTLIGERLDDREARILRVKVCGMAINCKSWPLPYRIGQRLRPCPGCAQCLKCSCGNVAACVGLYEPWSKHQPDAPACDECCGHGCEDGYCYKLDNFFPCDGSGVLPAKKAKAK